MRNTVQFHVSLMYEMYAQGYLSEEQLDVVVEKVLTNPQNFD